MYKQGSSLLFHKILGWILIDTVVMLRLQNDEEFMNKSIMVNNWLSTLNK